MAAAAAVIPPGGLIAGLLPPAAAVAESAGPATITGLFPAEEAVVRTAGRRRQAEFAAGRRCARAALAGLGLPATPVPAGRAGEPRWPSGVTGSITHCPGYRACAVALTRDVPAIGIDAEPDGPLPPGLTVASGVERAWIARQPGTGVCWDRLLFSAKEAVAKLWYPLTGQWPGFAGTAVYPAADGTFGVQLGDTWVTGRWLARDGLIVTAVTWTPA